MVQHVHAAKPQGLRRPGPPCICPHSSGLRRAQPHQQQLQRAGCLKAKAVCLWSRASCSRAFCSGLPPPRLPVEPPRGRGPALRRESVPPSTCPADRTWVPQAHGLSCRTPWAEGLPQPTLEKAGRGAAPGRGKCSDLGLQRSIKAGPLERKGQLRGQVAGGGQGYGTVFRQQGLSFPIRKTTGVHPLERWQEKFGGGWKQAEGPVLQPFIPQG